MGRRSRIRPGEHVQRQPRDPPDAGNNRDGRIGTRCCHKSRIGLPLRTQGLLPRHEGGDLRTRLPLASPRNGEALRGFHR